MMVTFTRFSKSQELVLEKGGIDRSKIRLVEAHFSMHNSVIFQPCNYCGDRFSEPSIKSTTGSMMSAPLGSVIFSSVAQIITVLQLNYPRFNIF